MRIGWLALSMVTFAACANDTVGTDEAYIAKGQAGRTFVEASLLSASPGIDHDDTVILDLETSLARLGDTGTTGTDVVTYAFTHAVTQTVCLEDHGVIAYHLSVTDGAGRSVAAVGPGECATIAVEPGQYAFAISSSAGVGAASEGTGTPVFIRPLAETTHCEDFVSAATAPPETEHGLEAVGTCIAGSGMKCQVAEHYTELPYTCPFRAPWSYSDRYECVGMDHDQDANCTTHLYQNCADLEQECLRYWSNETDDFQDWGDSGVNVWIGCFSGTRAQYTWSKNSDIADPVMASSFRTYVGQYCADVARDCSTGWTLASAAPRNCPGFAGYARYGDLDLKVGEVAIHPRTYLHLGRSPILPAADEVVLVLNGRCDSIPHRTGRYTLGPQTQAVVYPFADLKGKPLLFENDGDDEARAFATPAVFRRQLASQDPAFQSLVDSTESSITVTANTGTDADLCRVKAVGLECDATTAWDLEPVAAGETLLVGMPDAAITGGKGCARTYLFDYRCDDLAKLGLANPGPDSNVGPALSKAVLANSDTVLRTFAGESFQGTASASRGESSGPSTVMLDAATVVSAHAYMLPNYNHTILISLRKCCGCDLHDVRFDGNDLSDTVLVGSNMDGARFTNTNLVGADLRQTSLRGATFDTVELGDNLLGCAVMTGASMANPSNASLSTATLTGTFDWRTDSVHDGIRINCAPGTTDLSKARFPIQMLPRDTWRTLRLQDATLLDKADGYDLSGINLSGGDYSGLRAGGRELDMRGANLSGSNLSGADFSSVDLSPLVTESATLYADFSNTKIGGASFANANLEGADFRSVTIDNGPRSVNFSYSMLVNAVFVDADLGAANFSNAYLFSKHRDTGTKKAQAEYITARGATFSGAFLSNMTFSQVKLVDADFHGAQLVGTRFTSGDLTGTKYSEAYLQGADLSGVMLDGASFVGAYLSLKPGYWHYSSDDAECTDVRIDYLPTSLGDTSGVVCPNGENGSCDTTEKLLRKDKKIVDPPCVDGDEDIFGNTDCIQHEYLKNGTIPECNQSNPDVMQCGCLVSVSGG